MVAVIKTGSSLARSFHYNENKVKEGVARCIGAVSYPKDMADLTLSQKLNRLLKQAALNANVTRNSVHISLNFDPSETVSEEKLTRIAQVYMERIDFGEQPYLVYQHHDAAHPHIHILTTKIRADGSRIDMQNIGRNQSEKARKEIEESFGLVKAQGSRQRQKHQPEPVGAQRVQYGKTETKKAVGAVLDFVLKSYRYTSLPELNAVLGQYNVLADCGKEDSRIHRNRGLIYHALDKNGVKTGVAVKASDFVGKPTLAFLESRFTANRVTRQPHKQRVKIAVDRALSGLVPATLPGLEAALEKQGIRVLVRQNQDGMVYGITYVDHLTRCVFNGGALGKAYSAKAILERCGQTTETVPENIGMRQFPPQGNNRIPGPQKHGETETLPADAIGEKAGMKNSVAAEALDTLTGMELTDNYIPGELKRRRRKKRKKQVSKQP